MSAIDDKYAQMGGPSGVLGPPIVGEEFHVEFDGLLLEGFRRYRNGIIVYSQRAPALGNERRE